MFQAYDGNTISSVQSIKENYIYIDYFFAIILAQSSHVLSVECQSHMMPIKESDFCSFLEHCQCLQIKQMRVYICIMSDTEKECQSLSVPHYRVFSEQ